MKINNYSFTEFFDELELRLFNCGAAKVDTTWLGEAIRSAVSRLYYVKRGSFYLIIDGQRQEFTKGNWYLVPANSSYEFGCEEETEHLFFHFNLFGADRTDIFSSCQKLLSISDYSDKAREISSLLESDTVIDALRLKNAVLDIILKIAKEYRITVKTKKYSPCVVKAIDYIDNNLSEALTISAIAKAIFVSPSTLTKHMRNELSVSVNGYVDQLILTRAAQMIVESSLSLTTISNHFGFCDQFYFSRKFKAKFGVSPSEYRRLWNV